MSVFKRLAVLCLTALCIVSFAGCGADNSSDKVYYLNWKETDGFTGQIKDKFLAEANSAGIEVEVKECNGDANTQLDQLNEAIKEKPGAIVLLATDGDGIVPTVEKANEAGIPVFITNRDVNGGKVYSVMSDERQAGQMQGEYMAKNLPPNAEIVYLEGEKGNAGSIARWEGFKEACLDKRPDIKLLAKTIGNWSKAEAMCDMTLWLQLFPKIDGVVAANDDMALGAMQALKANNRLSGCLVSGVDATDAALKAVQQGDMAQTVKQNADGLADGLFQLISASLKGQTVENMTVSFTPITKDNVAQFIK